MFVLVIWFIIWMLNGFPELHRWNSWAVSLLVILIAVTIGAFAHD